jgi:hypothetical protein
MDLIGNEWIRLAMNGLDFNEFIQTVMGLTTRKE